MELNIKLYLESDGNKFMGIGVLWLLEKIQEKGSLRAAATEMNISYSKAYKMISNLESALGKDIFVRQHGGNERNGISLTPFASAFIKTYDNFQKKCKRILEQPFEDFKNELTELDNNQEVDIITI